MSDPGGLCPHGKELAPVGEMWWTEYEVINGQRTPIVCVCCNAPVRAGEERCPYCIAEVTE